MIYDPSHWYWLAADGQVYSSAARALRPATDPAYLAWTAAGGTPTLWPRDEAGQESAAELRAVLAPYGIPGPDGAPTPDEARAECARRIAAVASLTAQLNLSAYVGVLATKATKTSAEQADLAAFAQGVAWIAAMRARWKQLEATAEPDWRDDAQWPACPQAVIDLAARF